MQHENNDDWHIKFNSLSVDFRGAVTAVLVVLVIYGNALSSREEDQLYLNNAEQPIMASEQQVLIGMVRRLARAIVSLLASAELWVWIGLRS